MMGTCLREIRIGAKLKLRDVSSLSGFTPQYLCDVEKGRRKASLKVLQAYLKVIPNKDGVVSLARLLGWGRGEVERDSDKDVQGDLD